MGEILKAPTDWIPFLSPYPVWVKVLVCFWLFVTAGLVASLVLARPTGPEKPAKQAKLPSITLRFVAMGNPFNQWQVASDGKKPILFISTLWHVTNVPGSGLAVRLLKAHLLKPFAKELIYTTILPIGTGRDETIPEGETLDVRIHCYISTVLESREPFEIYLAIEDQFAKKHPLPAVKVSPC
jgi:hypothetical protein